MFPPWDFSALAPEALLPHVLASPSYTAAAAGTHQFHLTPPVQPLTPAPALNIWILSFPTVPQQFQQQKEIPSFEDSLHFSKYRAAKEIWCNQASIKVSSLCTTREDP